MQYFGGKAKIAKDIARILNIYLEPRKLYLEPFCGGLNVTQYVNPRANRVAMDLNLDLILLYKTIQQGWEMPDYVSEDRYNELKVQPHFTAEKAFAGFACRFSGKYWGGYARDKRGSNGGRNFADVAKRGLLRKFENLQNVTFQHQNFLELSNVKGAVIYCDPPYANTTGYKTGKFDSEAFWQKCRELSTDNLVFVSEYQAPEDFIEVWQKDVKLVMKKADGSRDIERTEKLFTFI
jgi:DNA adenine methylase